MGTRSNKIEAGMGAHRQLDPKIRLRTHTASETELASGCPSLPALRFEIKEAAQILRMSRAQLYNRMKEGKIKGHKDGARTYITRIELERYVAECNGSDSQ